MERNRERTGSAGFCGGCGRDDRCDPGVDQRGAFTERVLTTRLDRFHPDGERLSLHSPGRRGYADVHPRVYLCSNGRATHYGVGCVGVPRRGGWIRPRTELSLLVDHYDVPGYIVHVDVHDHDNDYYNDDGKRYARVVDDHNLGRSL